MRELWSRSGGLSSDTARKNQASWTWKRIWPALFTIDSIVPCARKDDVNKRWNWFLSARIPGSFRELWTWMRSTVWTASFKSKRLSRIWTTGRAKSGPRQYGYSWREIAEHLGLSEQQAKLRFQYAVRRLREWRFRQ